MTKVHGLPWRTGREKIPLGAQTKVNVSGLYVVPDGDFGYDEDKGKIEPDKDFICLQDIPPNTIMEVLIEKRTDPKRFGEFELIEMGSKQHAL